MYSNPTRRTHSILFNSSLPSWQTLLASILLILTLGLLCSPAIAHAQGPIPLEPYASWFSTDSDNTQGMAWGDVDGDGDLDLAVANLTGAKVHLNQDGILQTTASWTSGDSDQTCGVAWGDVDGDGDLDLAVASCDNVNKVYLNQNGILQTDADDPWTSDSVALSRSVAWGDVNGDGYLDLAVGNIGENKVYVNQAGILETTASQTFGSSNEHTMNIAWGDMDNDGDLDLAAGNGQTWPYAQQTTVYENDGGVLQSTAVWTSTERSYNRGIAWGDMDGDGYPELAAVSGTDLSTVGSYIYKDISSTVGSTVSNTLTIIGAESHGVAWGDIDGDGDLDLAIGRPRPAVYENQAGEFDFSAPAWQSGDRVWHVMCLALGDMDGDGDLDLAIGYDGADKIYANTGVLQPEPAWDANNSIDKTQSVAWGDADGDGDLDLAVGNNDDPNKVYETVGGMLQQSPGWTSDDSDDTTSVAWGDVDGDGDLDLAVANGGWDTDDIAQPNKVYLNQGGDLDSQWATDTPWVSSEISYTTSVAWGDMDGDGDLDLAVGNRGDPNMVYENVGGTLQQSARWTSDDSNVTSSIAWGDMDGDGDLDLAVGNRGGPNKVYENIQGELQQSAGWISDDSDNTKGVAWGDVDGDGDLDLAAGNRRGVNKVYENIDGVLQTTAGWTSNDNIGTFDVAWADVDSDGDLDLTTAEVSDLSKIYANVGGVLQKTGWTFGNSGYSDGAMSIAWGDIDGDGDPDVAIGRGYTTQDTNSSKVNYVYLHRRPAHPLHPGQRAQMTLELGSAPVQTFSEQTVTVTAPANFYAIPWVRTGTIPFTYTLSNPTGRPMGQVLGFYSTDGGGHWHPAVATPDTLTRNLAVGTQITYAVHHTFTWDVLNSGFFGQSDNVVFRLKASHFAPGNNVTGTYHYTNAVSYSYQQAHVTAQTYPFRVRGTQVRVYSETVHISNTVANALVYRLPQGQTTGGLPLANSQGTPFRTDYLGYLQGRGTIAISDTLFALLPITHTDTYTVYHTNATPTETGLRGHTVTQPGAQTITVTAAHPLILFNLDISLEWDARHDILFLEQLEFDLQRASEFLYDWTNGQAALGRVTLYHDREMWSDAHVRIYASNRLRPNATLGGIVSTVITDPLKSDITYTPGQLRMASVWNRYGESSGSLGEDWPRTLAHELGHYALFLDDAYLGLDEVGLLIPIDTCIGTAMADPYRDDYGEFHLDANWLPDCEDTLAQQTVGRSDWATIHTLYPWLTATTVFSGPTGLPLAVTQIQVVEPVTSANTLDVPIFYLSQDSARVQPGLKARAILFQPDRGRLIDLGRATLDQVTAHGARPGDRVCLYELEQERLGCTDVTLGDTQLALHAHPGWQPDVIVTPITSRTVNISVTVDSVSAPLHARLYPLSGPASEEITLELMTSRHYSGTFDNLDKPAVAAYVHIWIDEDEPRREIVTDYALGGNPVGIVSRDVGIVSRDVGIVSRDAPGMSSDGKAILFGETLVFTKGAFVSLQVATILPSPPPWATVVGQGYRLLMSADAPSLDGTSLRFQYSGQDVPPGEEHLLKLYFWDGAEWHPLEDTKLDTYFNTAVAPTQGEGLYVLMSSLEIPLYGVGWNNFAYPVQETRPVTEALESIEGYYNIVYGHVVTDTADPWKVHGAGVPDWVNDLKVFRFGQGYWINVTQPITLLLKGNADLSVQSGNSFPHPPATYYGPVPGSLGFAPTAGMTVTAWINGNLCGQVQTQDTDGEIWFAIDVLAEDWGQAADCGAPGRMVTFEVETQGTTALTTQMYTALWNNDRVWALPGPRIYLPIIVKSF